MELGQKQYEEFAELAEEIDAKITRAAQRYNALIKAGDVPMDDDNRLHTGLISSCLDELSQGVEIRWETTWGFGGHDQGSCFYMKEDLLDDTWEKSIAIRAGEAIVCHRAKIMREKNREERAERVEYEILKEKFEK